MLSLLYFAITQAHSKTSASFPSWSSIYVKSKIFIQASCISKKITFSAFFFKSFIESILNIDNIWNKEAEVNECSERSMEA